MEEDEDKNKSPEENGAEENGVEEIVAEENVVEENGAETRNPSLDPPPSESEDNEENEEESDDDSEPVETLVDGRQKRQTAGNRLSTLLDQEGGDDEVNLLFAEAAEEEDIDFEDPDAAEESGDDDDDSSTDDEDHGPAAGEDDLEGEKELQKAERSAKKEQKRKMEKAIIKGKPPSMRKRVKIDDSARTTPSQELAKPRKKSERLSWLPTAEEAPTRTSSRTLSVQSKERTIASMKKSEGRRARQIAVMEAAQKRRDAEKGPPMTQEERLAEAAKTERQNSKSLSKWEEMEKDRLEKQRAKLEALQNRTLEGPVIRWYSGPGEWINDKLVSVGKKTRTEQVNVEENVPASASPAPAGATTPAIVVDDVEQAFTEEWIEDRLVSVGKKTRTEQVNLEENLPASASPAPAGATTPAVVVDDAEQAFAEDNSKDVDMEAANDSGDKVEVTESTHRTERPDDAMNLDVPEDAPQRSAEFLDGIQYYAELPDGDEKSQAAADTQQTINKLSTLTAQTEEDQDKEQADSPDPLAISEHDLHEIEEEQKLNEDATPTENLITNDEARQSEAATPNEETQPEQTSTHEATESSTPALQVPDEPTVDTPPPPTHEIATRNLITLLNFDANVIKEPQVQRRILFGTHAGGQVYKLGRGGAKAPVHHGTSLCAVTGLPARYRDPVTGLPYAGVEGFKAIRNVVRGGATWSELLGAWVGSGGREYGPYKPARGVPEEFLEKKPTANEESESSTADPTVKKETAL